MPADALVPSPVDCSSSAPSSRIVTYCSRLVSSNRVFEFGATKVHELSKNYVPTTVYDKAVNLATPLVQGLDSRLLAAETVSQAVVARVNAVRASTVERAANGEPLVKALPSEILKEVRTLVPSHLESRVLAAYEVGLEKVEQIKSQTQPLVNQSIQSVLQASQNTIDRILPPVQSANQNEIDSPLSSSTVTDEVSPLTVSGLYSHMVTRAGDHVKARRAQLTNAAAPLVAHVHSYVEPIQMATSNRLIRSVERVRSQVNALQTSIKSIVEQQINTAQTAVLARFTIPAALSVHLEDLRAKLIQALDQATQLKDSTQKGAIEMSKQMFESAVLVLQTRSTQILGEEKEKMIEAQILEASRAVSQLLNRVKKEISRERSAAEVSDGSDNEGENKQQKQQSEETMDTTSN
jgi:hypothetical protein